MKRIFVYLFIVPCLILSTSCKETGENRAINNLEVFNNWYEVRAEDYALFFDKGGNPSVINYETMETTILCNVPNCTHTTSSCINLYLKDSLQLPVIYNDCMYFFVNVKSYSEEDGKMLLDLETQIRKYDFNNMSTEDVAVIEGVNANDSGGCYLVGSDYYFTANYGNPKYDELGNVISSNTGGGSSLFSVDLSNGKITKYGKVFDEETLYNEYPSAINSTTTYLMGKNKNELYIGISYVKEDITPEKLESGFVPVIYGETYTFNIDAHQFNKIDNNFSMCSMNGYHTYFPEENDKELFIENIETGEIIVGPEILSYNAMSLFNDKVWHDSKCFDIKNKKDIEISSNKYAFAIGIYKNNYIVKGEDSDGNIVFEKIPCEEIDSLF